MRTWCSVFVLFLGMGLTACNSDTDRRESPDARKAGRDAYRAAQSAKRDLKEAERELEHAGKQFREGWNEAKDEDKATRKK